MSLHTATIEYEEFTRPDGSQVGLILRVDFEVDGSERWAVWFRVMIATIDDELREATAAVRTELTVEFERAYDQDEKMREKVSRLLDLERVS